MPKKISELTEEKADRSEELVTLCRKMLENKNNDFFVRALLNDVKAVLEKIDKTVV